MTIQSRFDNQLAQLKDMLGHTLVKHFNKDNITQDNLHEALLYLSERSAKSENKQKKRDTELRRCIADVLLLLDGFDINDQARLENREFGTKQSLSIATEKST